MRNGRVVCLQRITLLVMSALYSYNKLNFFYNALIFILTLSIGMSSVSSSPHYNESKSEKEPALEYYKRAVREPQPQSVMSNCH